MPGEPEDRKTQEALKNGIALTANILDSLYLESLRRGVTCPEVFGENGRAVAADSGAVVFEKKQG